ncbi:hypothetical protein GGR50DRAFT_680192 [Xylaria sp. CBS 124048]|nr:hypothetical protein GGR50DRAFT_680192 [Xylaria sp. CBS 124048]
MHEKRLNDGSLRLKARKVSQGVKYRLKSLFGLSKGDEDHGLLSDMLLPEQHINSEQSYPFDFDDQLHETDDELRRVPSIEQAAISHVPSGIPSLHANTVYEQLRSQQGSIESFQNEQKASDEGSRVTSWCNSDSSAANSLNSCRYEEAGKKRLSIINENGAHICSSSIGLQQNSDQSNGSTTSLNRQVVPQETRAAFNGQRIYSALMKRMNEAKQTGSVEMESENDVESTVQLGAVPRQNSSRRHRQLTGDSAATIRYVLSDSDSDSASSQTGRKLPGGDGGDLQPTAAKQKTMHYAAQELAYAHRTGDVPTKGTDNNSPATPQTEHRLAVNSTLSSSRSSAFFGSPTRYLFRTQSPYRRALQDQMRTETKEKPMASTGFNPWMQSLSNIPNLPMPSPSTYGSDADRKLHYAESVYSTNEEDASAKKHTVSSADNGLQNPKITHGDATIFVNETDYEKRSSSVTHKPRVPSSSSSAEWKTWLSSNVSKLGEKAFSLNPSNIQTGLDSARSSRHIRENAQINDDGESQTFSLNESSPAHPAVHHGKYKIAHWNCSDDDDNEGADQDLAVPFDAGLSHSVLQRRLPFANLVQQGSSGPSVAFADTPARVVHPKTSAESFDANREGALADVPPSTFKENASNGRTNVTTKLMKRQPKLRASMANLIRRTSSGGHSGKADKASYAQHRVTGVLSAKAENVSPAVVQDGDGDDPYRIEGGGVLGPNQNEDVGSRRMVDIFLSSRRRRMASTDDESVFL